MSEPIAIIVPARLASTRFPRKLLHPVRGKPVILWTAERIREVAPDLPLYFAVDDASLEDCLTSAGFSVVRTGTGHQTGTDRLAEANDRIGAKAVINVQADEPLVSGKQIESLGRLLATGVDVATLAIPFEKPEDFANPNQVKVVLAADGRALYFSRSPVPYARDCAGDVDAQWLAENRCYRHLGLYAYTAGFLKAFTALAHGTLERIEKLEQLRALENGHTIGVGITDEATVGIDTAEDVEAFERMLGG